MEDISWVKPYLDKIIGNTTDEEKEILHQEKLGYINRPFYKYCYICEDEARTADTVDYNIQNFESDELFFQNPSKFNDPFDCYLGFSQTQMIKDMLLSELTAQNNLTSQVEQAIDEFFTTTVVEGTTVESVLNNDEFERIIEDALPLIIESQGSEDYLMGLVTNLFTKGEKGKSLFTKFYNNTLTICEQQEIVDIMFDDKGFQKYFEDKVTNKNSLQLILKMTRNDMKRRIESEPNSFLTGGGNESLSFLDNFQTTLQMFSKRSSGYDLSSFDMNGFKSQMQITTEEILQKTRGVVSEQFAVTCLSTKRDSPLMWSHYANKHYGFCLEYDFTHNIIIKQKKYEDFYTAQLMLFPVVYSETRPLLSDGLFSSDVLEKIMKTGTLPTSVIQNILYGLLHKGVDWSYEDEWRIIKIGGEKPTMTLPCARKVYLGANIQETAKNKIISIAKDKKIPVYQMFLTADKYKFDYYKVN